MSRNGGILSGGFNGLRAPNAPTITGVTTSIGSASVAFTAPTDTGDGAITSYVVTAVDESSGASTGGTGTSSPISLSLSSGTFKVRMQALNPYGPGRLTEYDTGNVIYGGAELWAWGINTSGELGDGSTVRRSSPVQVGALTTWSSVSAGNDSSLALKTDGTMWSWGGNGFGQLGNSSVVNRSSPVQIGALTDWVAAVAGSQICVAIRTGNSLWAWGRNRDGQFGNSTSGGGTYRSSPIQVGALTDWAQVTTGATSRSILSIKTNGTLWAWGYNNSGRLGDGTVVSKSSPVQIGALTNWAVLAKAEDAIGGAIKTDGTMWTWGANYNGSLGDGTRVYRSSPVQVGALTNWKELSTSRSCGAVKTDGTLWAWGRNNHGQLGNGTTIYRSSPVQVGALTNWSSISANFNMTATKTDGTLWSWGYNFFGSLGDNTTVNRSSPVQIGSLTSWANVSNNGGSILALYGVV